MGRFNATRRAGSAATLRLAAPLSTEWSPTGSTTMTITATRTVSIPPGGDGWGLMVIKQPPPNAPTVTGQFGATTAVASALTPVTSYAVYAAWYSGAVRLSDWSTPQLFSTI